MLVCLHVDDQMVECHIQIEMPMFIVGFGGGG
jgi:hypothetical protein